jgi:hypothetical protein
MEIERWMDIYSDDEPDLMGLELVREFDILAKRFYDIFDNDDLNEWAESSAILAISQIGWTGLYWAGIIYHKTVLEIGRRISNSTTWFAATCPLDGLTARLLVVT